jgi:hypothetical protein
MVTMEQREAMAAKAMAAVQASDRKEAKARGYKSVEAMYRANRKAVDKAILKDVCGGDKSLYLEAFGN